MPSSIYKEYTGQIKDIIEKVTPFALKLKESITILLNDKNLNELTKKKTQDLEKYLNIILKKIKTSIGMVLNNDDFNSLIDIYVQSLIFGLFISYILYQNNDYYQNFKRNQKFNIPLINIFHIIFEEFEIKIRPSNLGPLIQSIEKILMDNSLLLNKSMQHFFHNFYSDFLRSYNPKTKKDLGVIYTPDSIVQFIIESVDYFLIQKFSLPSGVVDKQVLFIDPAAGTMTFLSSLFSFMYDKIKNSSNKKNLEEWLEYCFNNQFYAFEIMYISFLIGYYEILMKIENTNIHYDPNSFKFNFFLSNALVGDNYQKLVPLSRNKTLVILGNPPYNVSSNNKIEWIAEKLEEYKKQAQKFDTKVKRITSFKALQNDYIKFIRFAQCKILENNLDGIIAFITPNTYLNDIATRGMRASLLKDFNEIWIIDLHGDLRRKNKNQIDENVFDIRQGVGITFFIKNSAKLGDKKESNCSVRYTEVFGTKEQKLNFLSQSIEKIQFQELQPLPQNDYLFVPDNFVGRIQYMQFPSLNEIFLRNIQGIVTGHDSLVIHADKTKLSEIIYNFYNGSFQNEEKIDKELNKRYFKKYGISYHDARDWSISYAREGNYEHALKQITPLLWRGFDRRWICYSQYLINHGTDRFPLMQYMLPQQNNIGIVCTRHSFRNHEIFSSCFISDTIVSDGAIEGVIASYIFPLKVNNNKEPDIFNKPKPAIHSNINPEIKRKYPLLNTVKDEEIFYYIYGILNTPLYRKKYNQGLREDFPRIPIPNDIDTFHEMQVKGKELADLHLLKSQSLFIDWSIPEHNIPIIKNPYYDPKSQKIYFSNDKKEDPNNIFWIGNISEDMWNFEIGGIKQLQSWLSGRTYDKNKYRNCLIRPLNSSEITEFLKICSAIKNTIQIYPVLNEIFKKIDK